jgi:hypothetical protein
MRVIKQHGYRSKSTDAMDIKINNAKDEIRFVAAPSACHVIAMQTNS